VRVPSPSDTSRAVSCAALCCALLLAALPSTTPAAPMDVALVLDSSGFGGGGLFPGILREGEGSPSTGVILLHGRGAHPDSHVVGPLRNSLNALGYTTLSIALPVPADSNANGVQTDFADYVADVPGVNYAFPSSMRGCAPPNRSFKGMASTGRSSSASVSARAWARLSWLTARPVCCR
jgi:hypothetical protein